MRQAQMFVLCVLVLLFLSFAAAQPNINAADFSPGNIINRDVCVIGGGSSGTYAAIGLRQQGNSVVVVEVKDRLGGHTQTYTDPATGETFDIGVAEYEDTPIVKDYFEHFGIPLTASAEGGSDGVNLYADFRTGKVVAGYSSPDPKVAITAFTAQVAKYPSLVDGYYLPDPVPADLQLRFGDYVKKYALEGGMAFFGGVYTQGFGDILQKPALYLLEYLNGNLLKDVQGEFLTTKRHDNSELYEKATTELGGDALLESTALSTARTANSVLVLVDTPSGKKLIKAKKLIVAIPPLLQNLISFDLDATERSVFSQFKFNAYYTGLLRTGIPDNYTITNVNPQTAYNLTVQPSLYGIYPTTLPGLHQVLYGAVNPLPDVEVQADILASVERLVQNGAFPPANVTPEFAIFYSHAPYGISVSAEAISEGFYRKLYALQGHLSTFYTGAAFVSQDSTRIWTFTKNLLANITI